MTNGVLLLFLLCLGSQNLNDKESLNLGFDTTTELPIGFLVGSSVVVGFICGGSTAAVLIPNNSDKRN
ncbi:hypothetical protein [Prochlorococcus sp. MIT 1341]|uniref:hypothetical protein n=1 Tax=Prochlorococcus sp. MIT 1341 TaxID=3096221 RepID=UPI002A759E7C|nr:hypothetical protein [Prochlorococcus sp. MIT 1341]